MTINNACGAKHVNLRKMSYPAWLSRHAICRARASVLSRHARSTNAWWRKAFYEKCIPASVGGDCAGLVDLAILAEEFYTVDPNVSLSMLSTMLGHAAGGWRRARAAPTVSAALSCHQGCTAGRIRLDRARRQRQRRISITRRRRAHHRAASGRLLGHLRPEAMDIRGHRMER